jgi:hypothetical protein
VRVIVEKLVEWRLAGETEVVGENLLQPHFVHHKSHITRPGFEPGPPARRGGKPATNRLSYGAASGHQVDGNNLNRFKTDGSSYTNAMWDTLAGRALLVPWQKFKVNSRLFGCKEGNESSVSFYSWNRADCSKFIQSKWKWCQVETTSEQSWSRERHTLCKFLDGHALFIALFHMYAATQGNEGQPSTEQHGTETGRCFASITNNAERRTETLNTSAAPKTEGPPQTYQTPRPV